MEVLLLILCIFLYKETLCLVLEPLCCVCWFSMAFNSKSYTPKRHILGSIFWYLSLPLLQQKPSFVFILLRELDVELFNTEIYFNETLRCMHGELGAFSNNRERKKEFLEKIQGNSLEEHLQTEGLHFLGRMKSRKEEDYSSEPLTVWF